MSGLMEKVMNMVSIGSSLANISTLHRFLAGIVVIIALTIISSFMACLLIAGVFFALYLALTRYGMEPDAAMCIVGGLVFLITAGLSTLTILRIKGLQHLALARAHHPIPLVARLQDIMHAFMEGLSQHP